MKKFEANAEVSENVQGINTFVNVVFAIVSIVYIVALIVALGAATLDGETTILLVSVALIVSYLVLVLPIYIITKRFIEGFAKIVEASEKTSAYIDFINEIEEEESK